MKSVYFSVFKGSKTKTPSGQFTVEQYVHAVRTGTWMKSIARLRATDKALPAYKYQKNALPAVTISGLYKTRTELKQPTGLICIDIDRKDNPKLKTLNVVDKECLVQHVSCSGEGIKIIYRCEPTDNPARHRRIFDAAVARLAKMGLDIKADPIVKSIKSLQYVSHDPDLYFNENCKLVLKALPPIKKKDYASGKSSDPNKELAQLSEYVTALDGRDITKNYEDWMSVLFGLSFSFGEKGRKIMHEICRAYPDYSEEECNEKYDACLERDNVAIENPVTVASVYKLINGALPKVKLKHLNKKYNAVHAVVVGQAEEVKDESNTELNGLVRYKLFLFKKLVNKKTRVVEELTIEKLNLNAFENLLRKLGFFRFEDGRVKYVRIVNNIVERVDTADVLRIITEYIEKEGDYKFIFKDQEYFFSWEEIALAWREIRGYPTTWNQIATSLQHWEPRLLKDTAEISYVPYQNGIVKVTADDIELISYENIVSEGQIWKERILPRNFKLVGKMGMFEEFFINVTGRGDTLKLRKKSKQYQRSLWYYGYMLQGIKRRSMARAWILYDIRVGNSGRTGKSIIGEAVSKIRNTVIIDGKNFNHTEKFAFQRVEPWTDVVFIDDPHKGMSLNPLFNKISGSLEAEKKNKDQVTTTVKFMFASNWILENQEASEIGRQFVTQVDDFYVRYGKENNDSITPVVDYHGKEFFYEWDDKDWNQFDSFSIKAIQHHLKSEAPGNTIMGNTALIRFIQLNEEELFFQLSSTFINNLSYAKDGGIMIGQPLMVQVIKDNMDDNLKRVKIGKIVRDFFFAIGVIKVEMSSKLVGNLVQMAYKINQEFSSLDFGEFTKKLPKPKIKV